MVETSFGKPYSEFKKNGIWQRVFDKEVPIEELIWHRDYENRKIKIVSGVNWKLQLDNQLPVVLRIGNNYKIPRMVYHRLIKGEGRLIIEIKEYEETK